MKSCPACHKEVKDEDLECRYCGIIFAKWEKIHSTVPQDTVSPSPDTQSESTAPQTGVSEYPPAPAPKKSEISILYVVIAVNILVIGGYFLLTKSSGSPSAEYMKYYSAIKNQKFTKAKGFLASSVVSEVEKSGMPLEAALGMMGAFMPKNVRVISKSVSGDNATLKVEGKNMFGTNSEGTVFMEIENGKWKVKKEDWSGGNPNTGSNRSENQAHRQQAVNQAVQTENENQSQQQTLPIYQQEQLVTLPVGYTGDNMLVGNWKWEDGRDGFLCFTPDNKYYTFDKYDAQVAATNQAVPSLEGTYRIIDATHLEMQLKYTNPYVYELTLSQDKLMLNYQGTEMKYIRIK